MANDATIAWAGASLALPRRPEGRSWAGRRVTLEERLDGSLWVGADGQHHRFVEAPPVAPVLRARKLERIDDLRSKPAPPDAATAAPSAASTTARPVHPWRKYPAVRPR